MRKRFLCGAVIVLFGFFYTVIAFAAGLGIDVEAGYSLGKDFNSSVVSLEYKNPDFLNFGFDTHLYTYTPNSVTTLSYMGFAYAGSRLFTKKSLSIDCLAGISSAQTKYSTYKTNWSTTPGIGLEGNCEITRKWNINAKAVGIIYSDGYSFLYQAGPEYKYNKWKAGIGIDDIMSVSTNNGQSSMPSNNLGGMVYAGYEF